MYEVVLDELDIGFEPSMNWVGNEEIFVQGGIGVWWRYLYE